MFNKGIRYGFFLMSFLISLNLIAFSAPVFAQEAPETPQTQETQSSFSVPQNLPYVPNNLRDPTEPYNRGSTAGQRLAKPMVNHLEMIFYQPGHSFIILNGHKFVEGETIPPNQRIKQILRDRVLLQDREDQPIVLLWSQLSVKESKGHQEQSTTNDK